MEESSEALTGAELGAMFLFRWQDAEPLKSTYYRSLKRELLKGLSVGMCLQVTGVYYENELESGISESIGEARAFNAIAEIFGSIDSTRISIGSMGHPASNRLEGEIFPALFFQLYRCDSLIREIGDRVVIDTDLIDEDEDYALISDYMADLAEDIRRSGNFVRIIAHTDANAQSDSINDNTLVHALAIRDVLVGAGIEGSRIRLITRAWTEADKALQRTLRGKVELIIGEANLN